MIADNQPSKETQPIIYPESMLPPGRTVLIGMQHVIAMFGATALAPILMGFDPNVSIFFSGIGTLLFFIIVGQRTQLSWLQLFLYCCCYRHYQL